MLDDEDLLHAEVDPVVLLRRDVDLLLQIGVEHVEETAEPGLKLLVLGPGRHGRRQERLAQLGHPRRQLLRERRVFLLDLVEAGVGGLDGRLGRLEIRVGGDALLEQPGGVLEPAGDPLQQRRRRARRPDAQRGQPPRHLVQLVHHVHPLAQRLDVAVELLETIGALGAQRAQDAHRVQGFPQPQALDPHAHPQRRFRRRGNPAGRVGDVLEPVDEADPGQLVGNPQRHHHRASAAQQQDAEEDGAAEPGHHRVGPVREAHLDGQRLHGPGRLHLQREESAALIGLEQRREPPREPAARSRDRDRHAALGLQQHDALDGGALVDQEQPPGDRIGHRVVVLQHEGAAGVALDDEPRPIRRRRHHADGEGDVVVDGADRAGRAVDEEIGDRLAGLAQVADLDLDRQRGARGQRRVEEWRAGGLGALEERRLGGLGPVRELADERADRHHQPGLAAAVVADVEPCLSGAGRSFDDDGRNLVEHAELRRRLGAGVGRRQHEE